MTTKTRETMIKQLGSEQAYKDYMAKNGRLGHLGYRKKLTPEQEQEIRLSLSKELGIAPSKIDWRGIYKSRAEQAKAPATKGNDYDRLCADRGRKTVELNRLLTREEKLTWKQGR